MDKEGIFFSCLTILIVFEVGYYLINPESLWLLGVGGLLSMIVVGVTTGIVAGASVLSTGLSDTSVRIVFFTTSVLTLLFRIDIPINAEVTIPLGIGLFYPTLTDIFLVTPTGSLSLIGFVLISILMLFTVISGLMIAQG